MEMQETSQLALVRPSVSGGKVFWQFQFPFQFLFENHQSPNSLLFLVSPNDSGCRCSVSGFRQGVHTVSWTKTTSQSADPIALTFNDKVQFWIRVMDAGMDFEV